MSAGTIFDVKRYAIHDGPGIRTTIFLKGCPLQCWWCHNPEGLSDTQQRFYNADRCIGCKICIDACPNQALALDADGVRRDSDKCSDCFDCTQICPTEANRKIGRTISVSELLQIIEQDRLFYDQSGGGVTFSGGEPLAQTDFLIDMLTACGRIGLHRVVDTSGYAEPDQILAVAEHADLFLYDLKLMDSQKHLNYTGLPNELILENLVLLATRGAKIEVRIPVIPGVNTDRENMRNTARFLASGPGIKKVHLLSYHSSARKKYRQLGLDFIPADITESTSTQLNELATTLENFGLQVSLGG